MALFGRGVGDGLVCDLALRDGVNANCGVRLVQACEAGSD